MPGKTWKSLEFRRLFDAAFGKMIQPVISRDLVLETRVGTRRICFVTTHRTALKRKEGPNYVGSFTVPFQETIYPLFKATTQLDLFKSKGAYGGYWRWMSNEEEYQCVQDWIRSCGELVFIRSALALSVALGPHMTSGSGDTGGEFTGEPQHTSLGELERRAKYDQEPEAIDALAEMLCETRQRLPFYNEEEDMVLCAVPPSPGKEFSLPSLLVEKMAQQTGLQDVTAMLRWANAKPALKTVSVEEKWDALEQAELLVEVDLRQKRVILVDDLYQSGTTMQYVAMRLQQAGAYHIYGIALVKSMRDSDNS